VGLSPQASNRIRLLLEHVVDEFNKHRHPEVTARLSILGKDFVDIDFLGTYCLTCGFYDYFEDFIEMLRDVGVETEIEHVEEFIGGATVQYRIRML